MARLITCAMRNPGTILIVVLIASIAATSQLPKMQGFVSSLSLIIEGDLNQQLS